MESDDDRIAVVLPLAKDVKEQHREDALQDLRIVVGHVVDLCQYRHSQVLSDRRPEVAVLPHRRRRGR